MPGVLALPPSSPLGPYGSPNQPNTPHHPRTNQTSSDAAMLNGVASAADNLNISEIKERAKETAQKNARGVSALSLIRSARTQSQRAQSCELNDDLKGALSAYTMAGCLAQIFMDHAEFNAERQPGKKGVLFKEFLDFQQHDGSNLKQRVDTLETKLAEMEKSAPSTSTGVPLDDSAKNMGTSIADRVKSLNQAGLSLGSTKRFSRETQPLSPTLRSPTSPPHAPLPSLSPVPQPAPQISSLMNSLMSPPTASTAFTPTTTIAPTPSPHAVVPPSQLGPPSPTSDSSSPRNLGLSLSEFSQAFPSIDELDEGMSNLHLPSAPQAQATGGSASSSGRYSNGSNDITKLDGFPPNALKSFPVVSIDPGPRPSSTPVTPITNSFISRPASPSRSPVITNKPSLGGGGFSSSPLVPSKATNGVSGAYPQAPSSSDKPTIPVSNSIQPRMLHDFMNRPGMKVLLVDIRSRDAFEREHIRGDAVVCIESTVLARANVSGVMLEDSLTVAPRTEWALFTNREKFDVVVVYDDASETYDGASGPISSFARAVYEKEFRKILKHTPMLLIGGLRAWKREVGEDEVVYGAGSSSAASSPSMAPSSNGLVVDGGASASASAKRMSRPLPSPLGPSLSGSGSSMPATPSMPVTSPPPTMTGFFKAPPEVNGAGPVSISGEKKVSPDPEERRRLPEAPLNGPVSVGRRPPQARSSISYGYNGLENGSSAPASIPSPHLNGVTSPIQYPSFPARALSPQTTGTGASSPQSSFSAVGLGGLSMPPQASISSSTLSRRRSEYIDAQGTGSGSAAAASGGYALPQRVSIDYPTLSSQHILRPPPPVASPSSERRELRHSVQSIASTSAANAGGMVIPRPPTIQSDYPVTYWSDMQPASAGLKNLGNTCYMNSTLQCLAATVPFARFFTDGRWKSAVNMLNPMGTKGELTRAFAGFVYEMSHSELPYLNPGVFRKSICAHAPQFGGSDQHDSQEFLSFLLDGLHEDLNRILHKPAMSEPTPEREAELERLPQQIAGEQEWTIYRIRNDSVIVDFFQGQFRNRMECMTCHKTSTTYNSFMYLSLPIPNPSRTAKVSLYACLDAFVREEVLEKSEAWHCPNCKTLRKATKLLSLSRLPPILLIHLKRFSFKGPFSDKIENVVDFPLKGLDLTNYMPPPLPPGVHKPALPSSSSGAGGGLINGYPQLGGSGSPGPSLDDPRTQMPPYRYDLYGVTNHFGNLSNGHYTAFIASRGGWAYCDDSSVRPTDAKEVVGRPAYVLYYKRVKT